MLKRTIGLCFALLLLLAAPCALPVRAAGGTCGEALVWTLDDQGTLTVGGTGDMDDYWPDDDRPPWYGLTVRAVVLEEGVTSVGRYAFEGCETLTRATLPASLTGISGSAFSGCSALSELELSAGPAVIGSCAFADCVSLTRVAIPKGTAEIAAGAFRGCSALTELTLPGSLREIAYEAFEDCVSLAELTVPEGVVTIGAQAFFGCSGLARAAFPGTLTSIGSTAFGECGSLTELTIPDGVTEIGYDAFYRCAALRRVTLPAGLTTVEPGTFRLCGALEEISFPDGVTSIGRRAFYGCSALEALALPAALTELGESAFEDCAGLTRLTLPDGTLSVCERAFAYCRSLESVSFPDSVERIGERAFVECSSLTELALPAGLKTVEPFAFASCRKLESAALPDGLVLIDRYAFYGSGLTELTIPASVERIGEKALELWYLRSITFLGAPPELGQEVFGDREFYDHGRILAHYPHSEPAWTEELRASWGTPDLLWVPDDFDASVADAPRSATEPTEPLQSRNIRGNHYGGYSSSPVRSGLTDNGDGTLTRVECASVWSGSAWTQAVTAELYGPDFRLQWKKTLEMELPNWGGYFAGRDFNFLVFGQSNPDESDEAEVVRIVRYTKNWNRVDSVSVYGANTKVPFRAGSLRMAEAGDFLYIHTCHTMYAINGVNHQANMSFRIHVPTMTVFYAAYDVGNPSDDYVSHSFNQFVLVDGDMLVKLDHGDAYPRSLTLWRVEGPFVGTTYEAGRTELFPFPGTIGANYTGCSVGGFAASDTRYLAAARSVDRDSFESSRQYNVFVVTLEKEGEAEPEVRWLTQYPEGSGVEPLTPLLVRLSGDSLLLLWEERTLVENRYVTTLRCVRLNGRGEPVGAIASLNASLSDCQPVLADGRVIWYVTDDSAPVFYVLDPDEPGSLYAVASVPCADPDHVPADAVREHETPAACEAEGGYDEVVYCSVCRAELSRAHVTVPALGHDWGDWTVTTPATEETEGEEQRACARCGARETRKLLRLSWVNPFSDVAESAYYCEPVLWAYYRVPQVTSGTSATTFSPENGCTRAQVVTFLWRAMGRPEPDETVCPFTDVDPDAYYYSAVLWAVERGVTSGTSATAFEPEATCTRAQIVTFLWRAMGRPEPSAAASPFADVPEDAYYAVSVRWAVERGVTAGVSASLFAPDATCTRGQVVTFLFRAAGA